MCSVVSVEPLLRTTACSCSTPELGLQSTLKECIPSHVMKRFIMSIADMRFYSRTIFKRMSSSLEKLVTVFDGSSYITWADSMRAWLRSQGLWQIASGVETRPVEPSTGTSAAALKVAARQTLWDNKNNQAFGSIVLRLAPSIRQRANAKDMAKEV